MPETAIVDTNVLLYAADEEARFHEPSRDLWSRCRRGEISLSVTPQILWEYFAVITNPKRVKDALTPRAAWDDVRALRSTLVLVQPPSDLVERMLELSKTVTVRKAEVFDLIIAVTALAADVKTIYSYDLAIFERVPGVTVRQP